MQKSSCLKFWITPVSGAETNKIIGREIKEFEKIYPEIKIDLFIIPWTQAWKRIMSAAKAKQLPDIFEIGNTWTKTFTAINALADITERVKEEKLEDKFYPSAWSTCEIENSGKIYALPWSIDARLLFYRKDIFKKVGVSPKDLDDWGSFEGACLALSGFRGAIGALGVSDIKDSGMVHNVAPWVWSSGGDFLSQDGTKAAFQNEESLRGIKFYFDLIQKGYAPILDRKIPLYPTHDFFISGKYAMCIDGSSAAASFLPKFFEVHGSRTSAEIKKKFGVTFIPSGPAGAFTFLGGSNLAISNYSLHSQEAWQFLRFLTSKESQIWRYKATGMLPAGIESFAELFHENTEEQQVLTKTYQALGRSYKQIDLWGSVEVIIGELFGRVIDSLKTRIYDENLLDKETNRSAEKVNYILSL